MDFLTAFPYVGIIIIIIINALVVSRMTIHITDHSEEENKEAEDP